MRFFLLSLGAIVLGLVLAGTTQAQHGHGHSHGGHGHGHGYGGFGHGHGFGGLGHHGYYGFGHHGYGHHHHGYFYPGYSYYSYPGYYPGYGYSGYPYSYYSYPSYGYGYNSYPGYSYATSPAPVTYSQSSYGPPPAPAGANTAKIQVTLPNPEAEVWIDGKKTATGGNSTRLYVTPALEPGKHYSYTVTAAWPQGGKLVTDERQVQVTPGNTTVVDFTQPAPAPAGQP